MKQFSPSGDAAATFSEAWVVGIKYKDCSYVIAKKKKKEGWGADTASPQLLSYFVD